MIADPQHRDFYVVNGILGAYGMAIHRHARTADDIVKPCETEPFDLILVDNALDRSAGVELVRHIRASKSSQNRTAPILMMAVHPNRRVVESARDAGVTALCVSPVTSVVLLNTISEVVVNPQPFIITASFIGPDRRRRKPNSKTNLGRRSGDAIKTLPSSFRFPSAQLS